jgi:hypothetical protein
VEPPVSNRPDRSMKSDRLRPPRPSRQKSSGGASSAWAIKLLALAVFALAGVLAWTQLRSSVSPLINGASSKYPSEGEQWRQLLARPKPAYAPARPTSRPSPDERVRLKEEWRKAFRTLDERREEYETQLEAQQRQGLSMEEWSAFRMRANSEAYRQGFRDEYDRLYASLRSTPVSLFMGDFSPSSIVRLEEDLELLEAELRRTCELIQREHELTMAERRKAGR